MIEQLFIATQVDDYLSFVEDTVKHTQENINEFFELVGLRKGCPDHYIIHINTLNETKMNLRHDYFDDVCDIQIVGKIVRHNQTGVAVWIEGVYS